MVTWCPRPASFSCHDFPRNPRARPCAMNAASQNASRECSFIDNRPDKRRSWHHKHASSAHDELHPRTTTQLASTLIWVDVDASYGSRLPSQTVVPAFRQRAFEAWHTVNRVANRRVAQSLACGWRESNHRRLRSESCLQGNRVVDVHCTTE